MSITISDKGDLNQIAHLSLEVIFSEVCLR